MYFETIKTPGLSQLSYIIGAGGQAAVIDPRRDCEVYVDKARAEGLEISSRPIAMRTSSADRRSFPK
jgi:hydroxyacylglutathione hydrolase